MGKTLDREHPGYKSIMEGKDYTGPATLFGKDYMTKYMPIRSAHGPIIGCLFIGSDITKDLADLRPVLKSIKIGDTGYVYAFYGEGKNAGTLVVHPTLEGKSLVEMKAADGRDVFRAMAEKKMGVWSISGNKQMAP